MALIKIFDSFINTDKITFMQEHTDDYMQPVTTLNFGGGEWLRVQMPMEKVIQIIQDAGNNSGM